MIKAHLFMSIVESFNFNMKSTISIGFINNYQMILLD